MITVGELKQLLNQYNDEDIIYFYNSECGVRTLFDKNLLEIKKISDVIYKRDGYNCIMEQY